MAQSLSKILIHVVFSTKARKPIIPSDLEKPLHAYIASACRAVGSEAYRIGGTADHIHMACTLPRTLAVSTLLERVKTTSSVWFKNLDFRCRDFAWQAGYGAFSLGQSQLDSLIRYVDRQHEHHQSKTFQQEVEEILDKYELEYDEYFFED